ncbi:CHAT domain-containing protein [Sphingomonas sp.]|jgi:hypothetical protein|uniref:CHAT domain-containing protein n=1 Tax=Sphingomonas sp. TaxID=28214 RepID=UPI002E316B9C|nr:CHAT domain-containing protein [Sphingomonas sp.]HEX4694462.1 CHAT domain-containing protein [Sphingomonas sp.]
MQLQELFPRWRAIPTSPTVPWTRDVDLSREGAFNAILGIVADEQDAAVGSPAYFAIAGAMVEDAMALVAAPPAGADGVSLQYMQFQIALGPFKNAMAAGDFGRAHDWIHHGLGDSAELTIERRLHIGRIYGFVVSGRPTIRATRGQVLADWAADFYYYARVRGTLGEAATALLPILLHVFGMLPPDDDATIDAYSMMLNWAADNGHRTAATLTARLRRRFNRSRDARTRTRIAAVFASSAGVLSGEHPKHWAKWALDNGDGHLHPHQRLQLLWQLVETEEDWDRLKPSVLDAIGAYAAEIARLGTPTAICRATDQRSGLLKPGFHLMRTFERSDDFLEILARWHRVPDGERLLTGALFVCATAERGTIYLGARTQQIERDGAAQIVELTRVANAMLGLILTIEGAEQPMAVPDRPGVPVADAAPAFEAAMARAYAMPEIRADVMEGRQALIAFPGQPHPLQAMLLADRGASLPISSSLETPRADRMPRRALLWAAGNDYYSGFETDAVAAVLAGAGVEIDRRSGDGARPDEFLAAWADPRFDIVWIAGHGEIDHWSDGSASLVAGEYCRVGIDELHAATPREGDRRLAVLNICDGGVSAVNGGIQKLGLAPVLASARQATVSHLWPVNPLVASAFGVLMASALADGVGFHAAFDRALAMIHAPIADIAAVVRAAAPGQEILARLENLDLDTSAILHWGSPCFFQ